MKAKICMTMALAAVCTMGTAQTQRAIDDIDKEIARLEHSDELQTRRADNANAFFNAKLYNQQKAGNRQAPHLQDCKTLYFKYLYEVGDTAAAPLLPKCIVRLERALKQNAILASQALTHDADPSGISSREIDGLTYAYSDSIGGVTAYSYPLDNLCNYATMTFCGNDSVRTNYMFAWKPQLFTDMESRRFCTIDGYIAKLTGKDWQANSYIDFNESGSEQKVYDVDETERIDTMTGDIAVSQVKMLAEKFRKSMAKGNYKQCDAIAFVMRRLAEKFDGTLTTEQYDSIKRNVWSMEETGNSQRNKALMRTVSAFRKKTEQKRRSHTGRKALTSQCPRAQGLAKGYARWKSLWLSPSSWDTRRCAMMNQQSSSESSELRLMRTQRYSLADWHPTRLSPCQPISGGSVSARTG